MGGLFAVFSYVKPMMMQLAAVGEKTISWVLTLADIAMHGWTLVQVRK